MFVIVNLWIYLQLNAFIVRHFHLFYIFVTVCWRDWTVKCIRINTPFKSIKSIDIIYKLIVKILL